MMADVVMNVVCVPEEMKGKICSDEEEPVVVPEVEDVVEL